MFIVIQFVRRTVPPLYMLAGPIGTVFLIFLSDVYGNYVGALLSQTIKITDLLTFLAVRHLYSEMSDNLCDPKYQIWWFSESFRSTLIVFDNTWRDHVVGRPWYSVVFVIWVFNMTYFFNDYVCLFWFATRSKVDFRLYAIGYVSGLALEYPKTLMKFKLYTGGADAAQNNSFIDLFKNLGGAFSWWEVLLIFCTCFVATCYVHGTHCKAIFVAIRNWLTGREKGGGDNSGDDSVKMVATAAERSDGDDDDAAARIA
jgi:hypothetical protein